MKQLLRITLMVAVIGLFPLETALFANTTTLPPLPTLREVMNNALERARKEDQNNREFQEHYAYKRVKVADERTAQGVLKKHEQKVSQHLPREPQVTPIRTTTPVNPASGNQPEAAKTVLSKKDFPLDGELLDRYQFTLVGRDWVNGRSSLVLDFKPGKNLPVHNFKDHLLNKAAGRAWVDENEFVIVKADVHLTDPISIGGGLLGSVKAFQYHFDRERTPEGYWFTKAVSYHAEAREFLARKILDHQDETLEVRKVK